MRIEALGVDFPEPAARRNMYHDLNTGMGYTRQGSMRSSRGLERALASNGLTMAVDVSTFIISCATGPRAAQGCHEHLVPLVYYMDVCYIHESGQTGLIIGTLRQSPARALKARLWPRPCPG